MRGKFENYCGIPPQAIIEDAKICDALEQCAVELGADRDGEL